MRIRESGILMHISSLPGNYGIGDFGIKAYEFVDFLVLSKQKNWQILPLGVTGYGDSPYQCFSAYAGNPYFIDIDELIELGFLDKTHVSYINFGDNPEKVDFGALYHNKLELLRLAYSNAKEKEEEMQKLTKYYEANKSWLREFALFMALKSFYKGKSWHK